MTIEDYNIVRLLTRLTSSSDGLNWSDGDVRPLPNHKK